MSAWQYRCRWTGCTETSTWGYPKLKAIVRGTDQELEIQGPLLCSEHRRLFEEKGVLAAPPPRRDPPRRKPTHPALID